MSTKVFCSRFSVFFERELRKLREALWHENDANFCQRFARRFRENLQGVCWFVLQKWLAFMPKDSRNPSREAMM